MSTHICSLGVCSTLISPLSISFLIKKYFILTCFVYLLLDCLQLISNKIALLLSCCTTACLVPYPCSCRKYKLNNILGMASSTLTKLLSVELNVFTFCFLEKPMTGPLPSIIPAPVWPLQSLCTLCDASTCHFVFVMSLIVIHRGSDLVPFKYFNTHFALPQSSSSGCFTLVVRKATAVLIPLLAGQVRNNSCANMWWNILACSSTSGLANLSSRTLKRLSKCGLGADF